MFAECASIPAGKADLPQEKLALLRRRLAEDRMLRRRRN